MFRRQCVDKWGAYRDGDFAEDWEIWLRWLHHGAAVDKLPQQMLVWNDAPSRATRADRRYAARPATGCGPFVADQLA